MPRQIFNTEIARILYEIGEYLAMEQVQFKPRAYQKAAEHIGSMQEELSTIYKRGGRKALRQIPGVGQAIAEKIEELLTTGNLKYYSELKKKTPVNLSELSAVEGLGPKRIEKLYTALGVRSLKDLERVAKMGKIRALPDFGEKSEEKILKGIAFVKSSSGRKMLGFMFDSLAMLEARLENHTDVGRAVIAGSSRRKKETIGDIDILATSRTPRTVIDFFVGMPEVMHVYGKGPTKANVRFRNGMDVDLRVVPAQSYGAALHYFTGSKDHNIAMREIALKKGMTLNEYGLFKGTARRRGKLVAGKSEEDIFKALGLSYIEPELREMRGEIEAARTHTLPLLIPYGALKGDLQVQTSWTDGSQTIEEMARAAAKFGLEYIAITDHTKNLPVTNGLTSKRIQTQWKEIDRLNKKFEKEGFAMRILKGTECDILKDGSLDLPDTILKQLDIVGVSVHTHFRLSQKEQMERVLRAMENPHVDILFHPTARLIHKRDPINLDITQVIRGARETGTVLEIDAFPDRSDLKDEYIKQCVAAGVKMCIDSDAHNPRHFQYLEYGISQARRGWATKNDIINAFPVEKMLTMLKGGR